MSAPAEVSYTQTTNCIVISLYYYYYYYYKPEINYIFSALRRYIFHCSSSSFGTPCCSGYRLRLQSGIRASSSGRE